MPRSETYVWGGDHTLRGEAYVYDTWEDAMSAALKKAAARHERQAVMRGWTFNAAGDPVSTVWRVRVATNVRRHERPELTGSMPTGQPVSCDSCDSRCDTGPILEYESSYGSRVHYCQRHARDAWLDGYI